MSARAVGVCYCRDRSGVFSKPTSEPPTGAAAVLGIGRRCVRTIVWIADADDCVRERCSGYRSAHMRCRHRSMCLPRSSASCWRLACCSSALAERLLGRHRAVGADRRRQGHRQAGRLPDAPGGAEEEAASSPTRSPSGTTISSCRARSC